MNTMPTILRKKIEEQLILDASCVDPRTPVSGSCQKSQSDRTTKTLGPTVDALFHVAFQQDPWHTPVVSQQRPSHVSCAFGSSIRHARPDDPQDAQLAWRAAWLRHRQADRAGCARIARPQPGTIYPALLRLEQKGWIGCEWGTSENNRRAKFYAITRAGRKQLAAKEESWARTVAMVNLLLEDHQ